MTTADLRLKVKVTFQNLRSEVETRLVGPRSSIEDTFLVVCCGWDHTSADFNGL